MATMPLTSIYHALVIASIPTKVSEIRGDCFSVTMGIVRGSFSCVWASPRGPSIWWVLGLRVHGFAGKGPAGVLAKGSDSDKILSVSLKPLSLVLKFHSAPIASGHSLCAGPWPES